MGDPTMTSKSYAKACTLHERCKRLVGRLVCYTVTMYEHTGQAPGEFRGLVRSVRSGPRMGFRSCRVQRPSNPDAKTVNLRYQGEIVTVEAEHLKSVKYRGIRPVKEFLA